MSRGRPATSPAYHYGRLIALAEVARGKPWGWLVNNCLNYPGELTKHFPALVEVGWLNTRTTRIAAHLPDWPAHLDAAQQGDALSGYYAEKSAIIRARWVNKLRREAGQGRKAFSEKIGISPRTLEAWEQHLQDVPHDMPDKIKAALNVTSDVSED